MVTDCRVDPRRPTCRRSITIWQTCLRSGYLLGFENMRFAVVEARKGPGLAWVASLALALLLPLGPGCSDSDRRDKYFGTDTGTEVRLGPGPEASPADVADAATAADATKDATDADATDAADA